MASPDTPHPSVCGRATKREMPLSRPRPFSVRRFVAISAICPEHRLVGRMRAQAVGCIAISGTKWPGIEGAGG